MILHLNGLRAVAIGLVLLFHCFTTFANGFLGVDVFLVISGYLLFRKFWDEDNSFYFGKYMAKKVERLFPLAAFVSLLCCVFALLLFPYDLTLKTAKYALSTLVGCSNIYYDYTFSDYFSSNVRLNPLLHTWYLSLIAQIYLIGALLWLICRRRTKNFKVCLLVVLSVVSAFIYYSPLWVPKLSPLIYTHSTYYWTSGRLWMVCAGAFAHLLPHGKYTRYAGIPSLLILLLVGLCPHQFGAVACMALEVLTVVCSALLIAYGGGGLSGALLNCRPLQILGRYSFSLYIVHWPVIVFFCYVATAYNVHTLKMMKVAEIVLSLVLAGAVYHIVEQRKMALKSCLGVLLCSVGCVSVLIYTDGMRDYLHAEANAVRPTLYGELPRSRHVKSGPLFDSLPDFRMETHHGGFGPYQNWGESIPLLYEIGNQPENADFVLIGDSHAEALYPGLDVAAKKHGWNGAYLHTYVIPFENVFSEHRPYQRWDREKSESLFRYFERNPQIKTVLLANYWRPRFRHSYMNWDGEIVNLASEEQLNDDCLREFLEKLRAQGKKVIIFTDVPTMPERYPAIYIRRQKLYGEPWDEARLICSREAYEQKNLRINDLFQQWEEEGLCCVVHPESVLFRGGQACCFENGKLLYKDGDHLSLEGSIKCIQSLVIPLGNLLKSGDDH